MGERLRLCYIGAGGFTNACMYPQLFRHDVELLAVCDLVEEKAQAAAAQYGFGMVYTDFREMLEDEQPDCVICVGGPKVHYEVGREVLERGFPLYVQKSPAPSTGQTQELADLAAAQGLVCHVGFNLRSCAAALAAREAMAEPDFGPVCLGIVRYGLVFGRTLRDAVLDQHCHGFDTLRWLCGEVTDLKVQRSRVPGDRGYVAAAQLAHGGVATVNFTSGQTPNKEFVYFEVTGLNGHYLTCHDFDLTVHRPGQPSALYRTGNYGSNLRVLEWLGYVADLGNFLAAVRGDEPDRAPIADAVATMALCEEAYRQLREQGAEE